MAGRGGGQPETHPQNAGGMIVEGTADRMGTMVISTCKNFVAKHKVISLTWVGGLLLSILATGFTPSPAAVHKYEVGWCVGFVVAIV